MMDPIISPLIVTGLVTAGLSAGTASILAPILSFIIVAAFSAAIYLVTAPSPPKGEDGKMSVQSPVAPRNYAYGRARLAGVMVMRETNSFADVPGSNLGTVLALTSHRIQGFVRVYLNDDICTFGGSEFPAGFSADGEFVDAQTDGRYGDNRVVVSVRLGLVPETFMNMFTTYTFPTSKWPTTARGDGIAQLGIVCRDPPQEQFHKRFPYGAPNGSAVCDTALLFDPRDVAQNPANPSTWVFSRNPALVILHYLCFSEFGFGYDYDQTILPVVNQWKHAADVCNELVPVLSGVDIRRYQCGGFASTDNNPKDIIGLMLAACDGWLCRRGDGSMQLVVGKFEPEGVTITQEDIIGFSYQKGVGDEESVNRAGVQLISQDHDYTEIECDPWDDVADQTARGTIRETVIRLPWVQDYRQARRVAKRQWIRLREPLRGTLELKLSAINAAYTRWVYIQSEIPALNNRYIENRLARFDLTADPPRIHMEFLGADSSIDNWTATEEGRAPPAIVHVGGPVIPTPQNLVVTKATYSGDQVLKFEWDVEPDAGAFGGMDHVIRYRVVGGVWRVERDVDVPINVSPPTTPPRWYVYSRVIPNPTLEYEGQVRVQVGATRGDWSNMDSTAT